MKTQGSRQEYVVPAIQRALAILEMMASDDRGYSISEVAKELELAVSTTSSLLRTLEHRNYLQRNHHGVFLLTTRLFVEGQKLIRQMDLHELAAPELEKLTTRTGFTTCLAIPDGDQLVYLEKIDGKANIQVLAQVGRKRFFHQAATGKSLLAHVPWDQVRKIVQSGGLPAASEKTITSISALKRECQRIRKRGYSVDDEESGPGRWGIGAPIFNPRGEVVAAVAVAGTVVQREDKERFLINEVKKTAEAISQGLRDRDSHSDQEGTRRRNELKTANPDASGK